MTQTAVLTKKESKELNQVVLRCHKGERPYSRYSAADTLKFLFMAVLVAFCLRSFVFEFTLVDGDSMRPTLLNEERMFVEKLSFGLAAPQRGQIIICKYPYIEENIVKRIIGLPGERVEIINGYTHINGNKLDESAYYDHPMAAFANMDPVVVPPGHVFVMGDNREHSSDSRTSHIGPIPYEHIRGRVLGVIWPFTKLIFFN